MKKVLLLLMLLISNLMVAQDGELWHFKFKFKLNTKETLRYTYKNVEVFLNDSKTFKYLRNYDLKYNAKTKEYELLIRYNCISCGYSSNDYPPEIYLRLEFEGSRLQYPFYAVVPIYFEKSKSFVFHEFLNGLDHPYPNLDQTKTALSPDNAEKQSQIDALNALSYDNAINLGTIDIKHFITDDQWKDDIERYQIIEVRSRDSIQYKKAGDYTPRTMNRFVSLKMRK
ncbi:hypothetical protein [Flavobacterium sp.]|uniref:hypothetical protein n=1 Tax=Flavobacterium sp. TaxID=239 RepID=UPI003B9A57D4